MWKTALVTGAAEGIGRSLAEALARQGTHVVVLDRNPVAWAKEMRAGGGEAGGRVDVLTTDLSDPAEVAALLPKLRAFPPFDLVVHNAGVSATGRFEAIPADAYERLIAVNAQAPMTIAPAMLREGRYAPGAGLVFISSLSHVTGYPGAAVYAASKDALAVYARSLRREFRQAGVHVTTIFPPPVRTTHAARHAPAASDAARRMPPGLLAYHILNAVSRRRREVYPGLAARAVHVAGRLMPKSVTRMMRRALFDKLETDTW